MAWPEASVAHPEARRSMEEQDDQTLLEDIAQRRDRASFAELFARYEKRAFSLALHLTGNHSLAQDAVQEAMLDIWLQASTFRPGNAAGWILRIVTNKSITLTGQRKQESRRMLEKESADAAVRDSSPADLAEREEQLRALRETLERLPLLDRQVLALSYAGGLSQAEVGAALSLSQMSISRRLTKACAQVRAQLEQAGYAVALPLVSAEGMCEAFCSGYAAPAGLRERVLEQTLHAVRASLRTAAAHSRRAAAAKTGGGAWVLGTAAAAIAAAGMGVFWLTPTKAPPVPNTPPVAAAPQAAPPAPERISRVWDFNSNEMPKDLKVMDGEWHRSDHGGLEGTGCMETDKGVGFLLDVPIQQLPVAITFQTYSKSNVVIGFIWERHDDGALFFSSEPQSFWSGTWCPWRVVAASNSIALYPEFALETGPALFGINLIHRKDRARIYMTFEKTESKEPIRIDNLRLESIRPEQVPDVSSLATALEKLPMSARTGIKILKGAESPVPGRPVTVRFISGAAELGTKP